MTYTIAIPLLITVAAFIWAQLHLKSAPGGRPCNCRFARRLAGLGSGYVGVGMMYPAAPTRFAVFDPNISAKKLPLVYVAGPYRAETREAVAQNVAAARHVGRLCVQRGWFPVMPTVNTAHFDHDFPSLADDQFWLDGTLALMRRCDAVVLVDGWQYSSGAKGEIDEAYRLGIKVYNSAGELPAREVV